VREPLDFEQAWPYIEKARAIAGERGLVITVAVHDTAGHPVAQEGGIDVERAIADAAPSA